MRKLFFIFGICLFSFYTCDDGDIITVAFYFYETFKACGTNGLVFYKTKNDPSESFSIKINALKLEDILVIDPVTNSYEKDFDLSSTNTFNYITYTLSLIHI